MLSVGCACYVKGSKGYRRARHLAQIENTATAGMVNLKDRAIAFFFLREVENKGCLIIMGLMKANI